MTETTIPINYKTAKKIIQPLLEDELPKDKAISISDKIIDKLKSRFDYTYSYCFNDLVDLGKKIKIGIISPKEVDIIIKKYLEDTEGVYAHDNYDLRSHSRKYLITHYGQNLYETLADKYEKFSEQHEHEKDINDKDIKNIVEIYDNYSILYTSDYKLMEELDEELKEELYKIENEEIRENVKTFINFMRYDWFKLYYDINLDKFYIEYEKFYTRDSHSTNKYINLKKIHASSNFSYEEIYYLLKKLKKKEIIYL